ncbi:MAG: ABC transporter ATP-binding protein/permease [Lachnospiraceae bacterium]|nr:ABC transporter ATP-binding protein/permease [Lachnospiraceae bacterium]
MVQIILKRLGEYKKASILTPVYMVLEVAMEMLIPLMMASIIDKGVTQGDMSHIVKMGGLMVVAAAIGLFGGVMGGRYGAEASAGLARNLRRSMYEKIQTFAFSNIDKFSTPGLITRMTTDVTNIQNAYQMILRMCVRSLISLIVAMLMSLNISPRISLIFFCAVLFLSVVFSFMIRLAMKYFTAVFARYDDLNESVQENITGIRVVKAFVREDHEREKFATANQNIYNMLVRAENVVVSNMPIMMMTIYVCILLISWNGAHMIVAGDLTTGQLMSLFSYCLNILMSLMMLSVTFVMITMSSASAKRIAEVLSEEPDLKNPEDPVLQVSDGSIRFDKVSFRYQKESPDPVLDDISLSIRSGETIGIIGATGSSKSSLVNLISRIYDVSEGSVSVGGIDVRRYDMKALRNQVAVVLQKNVLFSGTVLDNLRWGKADATVEECERVCRIAHAHEFVEKMEKGYETYIEQGGSNISGGQKQRLCIARALLKEPKVLILDDSTSAVDTATDAAIREALRNELKDLTTLIIAQRISSVQDADRILVLDKGRISGFDTHEKLLEENEIYRDIYESQTGLGAGADFDKQS